MGSRWLVADAGLLGVVPGDPVTALGALNPTMQSPNHTQRAACRMAALRSVGTRSVQGDMEGNGGSLAGRSGVLSQSDAPAGRGARACKEHRDHQPPAQQLPSRSRLSSILRNQN